MEETEKRDKDRDRNCHKTLSELETMSDKETEPEAATETEIETNSDINIDNLI